MWERPHSTCNPATHLRKEVVVHVHGGAGGRGGGTIHRLQLELGAVPRVLLAVRVADHCVLARDDLRELPAGATNTDTHTVMTSRLQPTNSGGASGRLCEADRFCCVYQKHEDTHEAERAVCPRRKRHRLTAKTQQPRVECVTFARAERACQGQLPRCVSSSLRAQGFSHSL